MRDVLAKIDFATGYLPLMALTALAIYAEMAYLFE